jgi:hypothetical protein
MLVAAKFVIKKGTTGKYHFNLIATNGQVIATSESYESKASVLKGIESVKRNAPALRSTTKPRANRPSNPVASRHTRPRRPEVGKLRDGGRANLDI